MKNTSKILVALGAGLAIGGVLGILFAPDKGSETRKKIAETPHKLAEKFKAKVNSVKESVDELRQRKTEVAEDLN